MRILVSHVSNSLNYGVAMMAANLVCGLRKHLDGDAEIHLECDDWHLQRFKDASNDQELKSYLPKMDSKRRGKARKVLDLITSRDPYAVSVMNDFDVLIVLGGDDLSETYPRAVLQLAPVHRIINRGRLVILAGLSLGPFRGVRRQVARFCWSTVPMITRDDSSYEVATRRLTMKHVHRGRCFAYMELPGQARASAIVEKHGLRTTENLIFVPSGLVRPYACDADAYLEAWRQIVHRMNARYSKNRIVLLSHVLLPERCSDKRLIMGIVESADKSVRDNIVTLTEPMQPAEARAILASARHVVTGRMHAAVSSCCMGVPPICLAYSEKFFGVIGRGMGVSELTVDCRERDWRDKSIVDDVLARAAMLDAGRQKFVERVTAGVAESREMVEQQIAFMVECIMHGDA